MSDEEVFNESKPDAGHKPAANSKHIEDLKSMLNLDEFKKKENLKREKRKRQKERRKLRKIEQTKGSTDTVIQTKATKRSEKARKIVPEVVTYKDPRKRAKSKGLSKKESKSINQADESIEDPELSMKQARFEVFKFGLRGLDKEGQNDARVALALKLGAKPKKKGCLPYAEYKDKIMLEKREREEKKEMEKLTGMRTISARQSSKNKKNDAATNTKKSKKKKSNESIPMKMGKFDGGMLRISKKELNSVKGRK